MLRASSLSKDNEAFQNSKFMIKMGEISLAIIIIDFVIIFSIAWNSCFRKEESYLIRAKSQEHIQRFPDTDGLSSRGDNWPNPSKLKDQK
jgi:hypothetical protein